MILFKLFLIIVTIMKIPYAIEIATGAKTKPKNATKDIQYKCPSCNKPVNLCAGKIRKPYFRHPPEENNPCTYYHQSPEESEIHLDVKNIMKRNLDSEKPIVFNRMCNCCKKTEKHVIEYPKNHSVVLEHRFRFNFKSNVADVVLLDENSNTMLDENSNIKYIFEIKNTHRTQDGKRPEPWFEIDASRFREYYYADLNRPVFEIECCRDKQCSDCKARKKKKDIAIVGECHSNRFKKRITPL